MIPVAGVSVLVWFQMILGVVTGGAGLVLMIVQTGTGDEGKRMSLPEKTGTTADEGGCGYSTVCVGVCGLTEWVWIVHSLCVVSLEQYAMQLGSVQWSLEIVR